MPHAGCRGNAPAVALPLVVHFFGEAEFLFEFDDGAVVEDALAGDVAEHLVGDHAHHFEIEGFVAVDEGLEGAVQPAVLGEDLPLGHELRVAGVVAGDDELCPADLMGLAAVEEHILACGGGIAKAVAEVPAEGGAVLKTSLQAAPIPGVVEGPHSSAPVEGGEGGLGIELPDGVADSETTLRAHTIYLLVVVEIAGLVEGGGDDHALLRKVGEGDIEGDVVALLVRVVELAVEVARLAVAGEGHLRLAVAPVDVAVLRGAGHVELAHREEEDGAVGELRRRDEIHHRDGERAHIAHVRDGEAERVFVTADVIVVPLLDAGFGRGDVLAVVVPKELFGVAGIDDVAVLAEQRLPLRDLFLHTALRNGNENILAQTARGCQYCWRKRLQNAK